MEDLQKPLRIYTLLHHPPEIPRWMRHLIRGSGADFDDSSSTQTDSITLFCFARPSHSHRSTSSSRLPFLHRYRCVHIRESSSSPDTGSSFMWRLFEYLTLQPTTTTSEILSRPRIANPSRTVIRIMFRVCTRTKGASKRGAIEKETYTRLPQHALNGNNNNWALLVYKKW